MCVCYVCDQCSHPLHTVIKMIRHSNILTHSNHEHHCLSIEMANTYFIIITIHQTFFVHIITLVILLPMAYSNTIYIHYELTSATRAAKD